MQGSNHGDDDDKHVVLNISWVELAGLQKCLYVHLLLHLLAVVTLAPEFSYYYFEVH